VQPGGFGAPPPQQGFGPPPGAPFPANNDTSRNEVPAKVVRGFIIAYGSNPAGDFWPLTGGRLQVGRLGAADGIDVSLQDPTISSRHAAIVVDGPSGTIAVEDTGSTNGTFVNDEHIGFNGRRDLRDGDRLRFGGFTTIVKVVGRV
jgi:pSer/pThr/pTyr-binding forkhead associated (FHA) protein